MKILGFAGSNSSTSINKQLLEYVIAHFEDHTTEVLDLNDYELPLFGIDREKEEGIPQKALDFAAKIDSCDLLLMSLAEHNGAYAAVFKNLLDWLSRIPGRTAWGDKPIFLMATSPGARGGASVLEMAKNRFPFNGGKVLEVFSLPNFFTQFDGQSGILDEKLQAHLLEKIEGVKAGMKA